MDELREAPPECTDVVLLAADRVQRRGQHLSIRTVAEEALRIQQANLAPALAEARAAAIEECVKIVDRNFGMFSGVAREIRALRDPGV